MTDNGSLPPLEREDVASPARHALQAFAVKGKKRLSILNTIRDFSQKSALSVKASLDSIRGDSPKPGSNTELAPRITTPTASASPRSSVDENGDHTPKRDRSRLSSTFSPRSAMSTWHLRTRSARQKRGSLNAIAYNSRADTPGFEGPERFAADSTDPLASDQGPRTCIPHHRRPSVASTLTGSIRGIGRIVAPRKPNAPEEVTPSLDGPIPTIAEASLPIDIPAPAPALTLELDTSGLMPDTFRCLMDVERSDSKLIDPEKTTTGVPIDSGLHVPAKFRVKPSMDEDKSLPPLPDDHREWSAPEPEACAPPLLLTPMPGTNMPLEVDGANEINPFESSIASISPLARDDGNIRQPMGSLSAIAEAVTVSVQQVGQDASFSGGIGLHQSRSAPQTFGLLHSTPKLPVIADNSNPDKPTVSLRMPVERHAAPGPAPSQDPNIADERSVSTASPCPSDMPQLCRFNWPPPAGGDVITLQDGGSPAGCFATSGPSSPTRRVQLPLRLKASPIEENAVHHGCPGQESVFFQTPPRTRSPVGAEVEEAATALSNDDAESRIKNWMERRAKCPCCGVNAVWALKVHHALEMKHMSEDHHDHDTLEDHLGDTLEGYLGDALEHYFAALSSLDTVSSVDTDTSDECLAPHVVLRGKQKFAEYYPRHDGNPSVGRRKAEEMHAPPHKALRLNTTDLHHAKNASDMPSHLEPDEIRVLEAHIEECTQELSRSKAVLQSYHVEYGSPSATSSSKGIDPVARAIEAGAITMHSIASFEAAAAAATFRLTSRNDYDAFKTRQIFGDITAPATLGYQEFDRADHPVRADTRRSLHGGPPIPRLEDYGMFRAEQQELNGNQATAKAHVGESETYSGLEPDGFDSLDTSLDTQQLMLLLQDFAHMDLSQQLPANHDTLVTPLGDSCDQGISHEPGSPDHSPRDESDVSPLTGAEAFDLMLQALVNIETPTELGRAVLANYDGGDSPTSEGLDSPDGSPHGGPLIVRMHHPDFHLSSEAPARENESFSTLQSEMVVKPESPVMDSVANTRGSLAYGSDVSETTDRDCSPTFQALLRTMRNPEACREALTRLDESGSSCKEELELIDFQAPDSPDGSPYGGPFVSQIQDHDVPYTALPPWNSVPDEPDAVVRKHDDLRQDHNAERLDDDDLAVCQQSSEIDTGTGSLLCEAVVNPETQVPRRSVSLSVSLDSVSNASTTTALKRTLISIMDARKKSGSLYSEHDPQSSGCSTWDQDRIQRFQSFVRRFRLVGESDAMHSNINELLQTLDTQHSVEDKEDAYESTVSPEYFSQVSADGPPAAYLMGSPTEFALRQSERNMRYNSLNQQDVPKSESSSGSQSPATQTPPLAPPRRSQKSDSQSTNPLEPASSRRDDSPNQSLQLQYNIFTPTLACIEPATNRFSVSSLDSSSRSLSGQKASSHDPDPYAVSEDKENCGPGVPESTGMTKASPARYKKRRSFLSIAIAPQEGSSSDECH